MPVQCSSEGVGRGYLHECRSRGGGGIHVTYGLVASGLPDEAYMVCGCCWCGLQGFEDCAPRTKKLDSPALH